MNLREILINSGFNNPDELLTDDTVAFIAVSKDKVTVIDKHNYWMAV